MWIRFGEDDMSIEDESCESPMKIGDKLRTKCLVFGPRFESSKLVHNG